MTNYFSANTNMKTNRLPMFSISSVHGSYCSLYDKKVQNDNSDIYYTNPDARRRQRLPSDAFPSQLSDYSDPNTSKNLPDEQSLNDEGFSSQNTTPSRKSFGLRTSIIPSLASLGSTAAQSETEISRDTSLTTIPTMLSVSNYGLSKTASLTTVFTSRTEDKYGVSRRSSLSTLSDLESIADLDTPPDYAENANTTKTSLCDHGSAEEKAETNQKSQETKEPMGYMPENDSSDDLTDDIFLEEEAASGSTPAFDAFGETKRRKIQSYNLQEKCLVMCRLLIYLVLFTAVLGGGILTKLSVLSLVSNYRQSSGKERTTNAIYLLTVICIYPCFTFVSSLIKLLFGKTRGIPAAFLMFMVFMDTLHTCGVLLLAFKVLPQISGISALYLMMCVPIGPAVFSCISTIVSSRGKFRRRSIKMVVRFTGTALLLSAMAGFFSVIDRDDANVIWLGPVSVILISLGWWENYLDVKIPICCRKKLHLGQKVRNVRDIICFWTSLSKVVLIAVVASISVYSSVPFFSVEHFSSSSIQPTTPTANVTASTLASHITGINPCQDINALNSTNVNSADCTTVVIGSENLTTDASNIVTAGNGNITMTAGNGNITVIAGNGNITVTAGNGNITVTASNENTTVTAGNGNITVTAGNGNTIVTATNGNTTVITDNGNVTVLPTNESQNTKESSSWALQMYTSFKTFVITNSLVLRIILQTFIVSYCATLACKLHMQRFAFALATLLIGPGTLLYLLLRCNFPLSFDIVDLKEEYICPSGKTGSVVRIALVCLLWAGLCIVTLDVWKPHIERMAKIERMFIPPLKDCLFVDYNLLLRRKKDTGRSFEETNVHERIVPKVFICATMWHENRREMVQLLKSLLRIDRHCAVSKAAEEKFFIKVEDPDKFEPEIHVIFDDAFCTDETSNQPVLNKYIHQFFECLDEATCELLGEEAKKEWNSVPAKSSLPYGGRLSWILPGGTSMVVHLKNKQKIRHRKRWSQLMYLYYLLGFKTFDYKSKKEILTDSRTDKRRSSLGFLQSFAKSLPESYKQSLENTYILTLDGDVDFQPKSVLLLIDRMKKNSKVGAVCGRIHPIGSGPVVWYQKFEYAVGHWLQKSAEHVLGCVLCCPGCFSLFRASALIDDNVVKTYTKKPTEAVHYIQFEQGEDRWLCTLLLQQGYKIDYCAGADAHTFAPESFNEFFIQRRRWSPSTNANIFDLLLSWHHTVRQNENINRLYIAYQGLLLATSLLAPATVTLMIAGAFSTVLEIDSWTSYFMALAPIVIYVVICMKCKQETQLFVASVFSSIYCIVMIIVTVGTILNVVSDDILSPNVLFLAGVAIIFVTAALWHPKEFGCVLHGLLYYVAVPSTFIFLTVYYICNLHVVTWGTREDKKVQPTTQKVKNKSKVPALVRYVTEKLLRAQLYNRNPQQTDAEEDVPVEEIQIKPKSLDPVKHDETFWMTVHPFSRFAEERECKNEKSFWRRILKKYLLPIEGDKNHEQRIKEDLLALRNNVVFAFFMINFMFSIALLQLQMNRDKLTKFYLFGKYEPVSVFFLCIFSFLLVLQFISMLIHRWGTFQHLVSSTHVMFCRKLTEKEKFEIHFEEAKEHIDDPQPENDNDGISEVEIRAPLDSSASLFDDETSVPPQSRRSSVYDRRFRKNYQRTIRMHSTRRPSIDYQKTWAPRAFPTLGRNKKQYLKELYVDGPKSIYP